MAFVNAAALFNTNIMQPIGGRNKSSLESECNKSSYFYGDFGLIYYNSNIRNIKIRTYYHS